MAISIDYWTDIIMRVMKVIYLGGGGGEDIQTCELPTSWFILSKHVTV
jgi:hypothetical protein